MASGLWNRGIIRIHAAESAQHVMASKEARRSSSEWVKSAAADVSLTGVFRLQVRCRVDVWRMSPLSDLSENEMKL